MKSRYMISVVYFSSAAALFTDQELVTLLRHSRDYNARHSITGLLLYRDGNFIQVLEGPEEAVLELLAKIEKDPRHKDMHVMTQEPLTTRLFPDWAMGFRNVGKLLGAAESGGSAFLEQSLVNEAFGEKKQAVLMLLNLFRSTTRSPFCLV